MIMSQKCRNKHNNKSENPLASRRTDGGKNTENPVSRRYTVAKMQVTIGLQCMMGESIYMPCP